MKKRPILKRKKKSQRETMLEIENLGKRSGVIDVSITNRTQELEERISGAENTIENIKEETQKSLKELQENTTKHVKEPNKTIQDLKIQIKQ